MITYELGGKLYINLTNRCSNHCVFCVRDKPDSFDYDLWLEKEPTAQEVIEDIGTADKYEELIFAALASLQCV
jgi:TatD family-associated radical SAM protein